SFQAQVRTIALQLGSDRDYFDGNNVEAIVVTQDLEYAFVTGFNKYVQGVPSHDPNTGGIPGGSNVGIIKDPLGPNPQLIAATSPISLGGASNLVLSPDERYLYVDFRGVNSVFVFDAALLRTTVENPRYASQLDRVPIDELLSTGADQNALKNAID